jgi:hypothetical protein
MLVMITVPAGRVITLRLLGELPVVRRVPDALLRFAHCAVSLHTPASVTYRRRPPR